MRRTARVSQRKPVSRPRALGVLVSKEERTWTDDDVKRLLGLKLVICQLVKPRETTKLYGIRQRLSAMRLRLDGSLGQHPRREMLERIPPITATDCAFISGVLKTVLNGERDAYKAFGLALLDRNPPNPRTPFMAAEYELCRRIYPKPLHKAARSQIAARYRVSDTRVSQARSKYEKEIDSWIAKAIRLAKSEAIPPD